MTLEEARKFRPLGDKILVRRLPLQEQSMSGLFLRGRDFPTVGQVLAIGPTITDISPSDLVQWTVEIDNFDLKSLGPDLLLLDYSDLNFIFPESLAKKVLDNLGWLN